MKRNISEERRERIETALGNISDRFIREVWEEDGKTAGERRASRTHPAPAWLRPVAACLAVLLLGGLVVFSIPVVNNIISRRAPAELPGTDVAEADTTAEQEETEKPIETEAPVETEAPTEAHVEALAEPAPLSITVDPTAYIPREEILEVGFSCGGKWAEGFKEQWEGHTYFGMDENGNAIFSTIGYSGYYSLRALHSYFGWRYEQGLDVQPLLEGVPVFEYGPDFCYEVKIPNLDSTILFTPIKAQGNIAEYYDVLPDDAPAGTYFAVVTVMVSSWTAEEVDVATLSPGDSVPISYHYYAIIVKN